MKACKRCLEEKPLSAFHKRSDSLDGRRGECKDCQLAYNRVRKRIYRKQKGEILDINRLMAGWR